MKGIIVVDIPNDGCRGCYMMRQNNYFDFSCSANRKEIPREIIWDGRRPEWCCIREVGEAIGGYNDE